MIQRLLLGAALALGLADGAPAQVGPIPGMGPLPFAGGAAACGTPAVTNIGNGGATGGNPAITGVTVPSGSLILVVATDEVAALGSVSDGVNTYSLATSISANGGGLQTGLFYAPNASLSSGTITYTRGSGSVAAEISAVYSSNILGVSPLDTAVSATAQGSSAAPSVTSGTPVQSGELFVGGLGAISAAGLTITQDTGHGWAFPPNTGSQADGFGSLVFASGGTQVNAGTGTKIFAPTLNAARPWGILVAGFKHC